MSTDKKDDVKADVNADVKNDAQQDQQDVKSPLRSVIIDSDGVFKFIMIELKDPKRNLTWKLVRGSLVSYHRDILHTLQDYLDSYKMRDYELSVLGGGRMSHNQKDKLIKIWGYSMEFGTANLEEVTEMVKKEFPDYTVSFEYGGY